jgi:hypothetical protein
MASPDRHSKFDSPGFFAEPVATEPREWPLVGKHLDDDCANRIWNPYECPECFRICKPWADPLHAKPWDCQHEWREVPSGSPNEIGLYEATEGRCVKCDVAYDEVDRSDVRSLEEFLGGWNAP